ncbi:alpha-amylase [Bifidobacterium ramosum]|uniref:Alpha-amylase n=1 Tax=Bifidobacterium ramosum TaxID=1798158 RepID=A0A6L4X4B2_9BIFI|nr:alpha-amylase family protein [Bifidobacterium ramosum]KAB8289017.1 alpha-amylase [Bifidobacterium ramosum]NEG70731.1 alpha-amylase [Bifidobacterium ramosum]
MTNDPNLTTIWWQIYPLGFTGAPIRPQSDAERALTPRLDMITSWLDYLIDLGANGLMLNPIFASTSHGYDTVDYYRIDPRLGDDAAFDRLVAACHERGIRIMLDGVFNHIGRESALFQQALAGDDPAAERMFRIDRDATTGNVTDYARFEGNGDLPSFNHDDPAVARLVADVMLHWMRRGVDAWRLDAAYAVPPAFWTRVLPDVRREFPHAWIMGEVIHGDYAAIARDSGMDSVTQYELWKAIWSSIKSGNFYELDWSLKRHNEFMRTFTPLTFVGNHDVTRIVSQIGEAEAALAMTVLLTVGGVPSIYYGDEQAWRGVKADVMGGDDAVRPMFPATRDGLGGDGAWMFRLIQGLISIRRRNPWMARAVTEPTQVSNRVYSYDVVGTGEDAGRRLHVDLRLGERPTADISEGGVNLYHVVH